MSITYWNFRMRNCSGKTYYLLSNNACLNSCPLYYYLNTTFIYCISCYYTCYQCTDSLNTSCSACDNNIMHRNLLVNSCICLNGYYDIGITQCSPCHSTCMTCNNNTNISCLTCDSTINR
jgi:proprotein convertase subtilisin/kexin type 5